MKSRLWLILGGLCFFMASGVAQDRYVVHFSDKDNSVYSVNNPSEFLSQKAIQRRADQNIEITEQDFPVNLQYVQEVASVSSTSLVLRHPSPLYVSERNVSTHLWCVVHTL